MNKDEKYLIIILIATTIFFCLIIGLIYVNIRIEDIEDSFRRQTEINEYILNRIEGVYNA